jgi:hypothetical protein
MRAFVLCLIVSLGFLAVSIRAVRRRQLREQGAILWLTVSAVMVLLSLSLPLHLLDHVSHAVGVAVPSNMVLLLAVLFLVMLVFHLSITVARLSDKTTALAQEIGILTAKQPDAARLEGDASPAEEGATSSPAGSAGPR